MHASTWDGRTGGRAGLLCSHGALSLARRHSYKEWHEGYEKMGTYVVPRSGKLLQEDTEYGLFRVICFKKSTEEFKAGASRSTCWRAQVSLAARPPGCALPHAAAFGRVVRRTLPLPVPVPCVAPSPCASAHRSCA